MKIYFSELVSEKLFVHEHLQFTHTARLKTHHTAEKWWILSLRVRINQGIFNLYKRKVACSDEGIILYTMYLLMYCAQHTSELEALENYVINLLPVYKNGKIAKMLAF